MVDMKDIWRESMARFSEKLGREEEASKFRAGQFDYTYEDSNTTLGIALKLIEEGWKVPSKTDIAREMLVRANKAAGWQTAAEAWATPSKDTVNVTAFLDYIVSCLPDSFSLANLK